MNDEHPFLTFARKKSETLFPTFFCEEHTRSGCLYYEKLTSQTQVQCEEGAVYEQISTFEARRVPGKGCQNNVEYVRKFTIETATALGLVK